jgi:UDP-glucose 4-epimerase
MRVLVTGVAGFIGSNTAQRLLDEGHEVVGLDNLARGRRANVPAGVTFVEASCGDVSIIRRLGHFDACIHFAAFIEVAESMAQPEAFFENNVAASLRLFDALIATGTTKLVFSSSAAVYGNVSESPIEESAPTQPSSPYGESKLMVERALTWLAHQGRLRSASLRYFNAAGAGPDHGEHHVPETHLIPLALDAALGRRGPLQLFGTDYPTRDGTCVRDYVHVLDLAQAHILAIDALDSHTSLTVNLGTGTGSSIREVLDSVERVTNLAVPFDVADRRPGDPAQAVASNALARDVLGWAPRYDALDAIVFDAYQARLANS